MERQAPVSSSSPQAREMADESMVRNLSAQAEAIWPQEKALFARYGLPGAASILDAGCGTGEITARIAELSPSWSLTGVDLEESHLERARRRCTGPRFRFHRGDVLELPFADDQFDLVVSRHVLQAVPDAPRAIAEMVRVTRPKGRVHILAEDYGMLWCHPTAHDSDGFWQALPQQFAQAVGCDNHVGRKMFTYLSDLKLTDIQVDYGVVDTLRVPREVFARIWEAWRDGYTDSLAQHTTMKRAEIDRRWEEMIACVRDPKGYALWQVPIWSAQKP